MFKQLLNTLTLLSEAETKVTKTGREHKGDYGTSYDGDDEKKPAASGEKRGRGRPKKGADDSGEVKSYDTKTLGNVFGGGKAPKKPVGTVSKKHSLKEYIEEVSITTLFESQIEEAVSRKDFRMVADLIKNIEDPAKRAELAQHHAQIFKQQNPRFSPEKFYAAVGIDSSLSEEEITIKPMPGASQIVGADGESLGTADPATANVLKQAAAKGTLNLGGQKMAEGKKAKPDFLDLDDDDNTKESMKKAAADKKAGPKKGVNPFAKKKVKESISFTEMSQQSQSEAQEMLAELQDDIDNFVNSGHCSEKLEAFLKVHGHVKKKITDESSIRDYTQHGMDAKPSKFIAVPANPKPTPFSVDPIQATTDRAGSFIKSIIAPKKTNPFESTEMKDIQVESWEKQLNGLLTEGITVSSSTGQQGSPDSVSVNATDADAQQLLQVLRQAGVGVFGGDQPSSNYGAPMNGDAEGSGTEPEMSPTVVGDGDGMMALIKKMTGIQDSGESDQARPGTLEPAQGGEEGGQDYEDEGSEEHDKACGECGNSSCSCDDEEVDEGYQETDEGNKFIGNRDAAIKAGENEFSVDGQTYPVKEDEHNHDGKETCNECGSAMYEGHECDTEQVEEMFANNDDERRDAINAANPPKTTYSQPDPERAGYNGPEIPVKHNTYDRKSVASRISGKDSAAYDYRESMEETFANDAGGDAMGQTELMKLKALLGMGNDMHKPKNDRATGNIQKVTMETKLMKDSSNLLADYKKLSGL